MLLHGFRQGLHSRRPSEDYLQLCLRKEDLSEAANVIEELSSLVDHYGGETGLKNLREYASKYWDLVKEEKT